MEKISGALHSKHATSKRSLNMRHFHRPSLVHRPNNPHHIEPHRVIPQIVRLQERLGRAGHAALLLGGDRFGGGAGSLVAAGLHLDEHQPAFGRPLVDRDEVELAEPVPCAREENAVALPTEQPGGVALAPLAERAWAAEGGKPTHGSS